MKIGFTGSRRGSTNAQKGSLFRVLDGLGISQGHHGNCIGWDSEVHDMLREHYPEVLIVCHDPKDQGEDFADRTGDEHRAPKTHFARNREIVDETDLLVVLPSSDSWMPRGGTWYTHDYALKRGKPVIVVWPDGKI